MESSDNHLQQKINKNGERLVGNEKANTQRVSADTKRPVRGIDWTEILARNGLESPGYKETIEKMKAEGRLRDGRYT